MIELWFTVMGVLVGAAGVACLFGWIIQGFDKIRGRRNE